MFRRIPRHIFARCDLPSRFRVPKTRKGSLFQKAPLPQCFPFCTPRGCETPLFQIPPNLAEPVSSTNFPFAPLRRQTHGNAPLDLCLGPPGEHLSLRHEKKSRFLRVLDGESRRRIGTQRRERLPQGSRSQRSGASFMSFGHRLVFLKQLSPPQTFRRARTGKNAKRPREFPGP